ncbi:hypothetical protein [Rhizobium phage RHEph24]|nr:hypothetical protein [Rhizobium phage RHEph24]
MENWDIYQMTNGRIVIHNWYDIYHDHDYYPRDFRSLRRETLKQLPSSGL